MVTIQLTTRSPAAGPSRRLIRSVRGGPGVVEGQPPVVALYTERIT
jgi:hypothetical protein